MTRSPSVLLVNPWITDFAAYDLWAKPLGLLLLGALMREGGCRVHFIDCLQRHDPDTQGRPDVLPGRDDDFGTGKYDKMPIPVPEILADLGRPFFRYGLHPESFRKKLLEVPRPNLVCVTSHMTYWYPGVQETIAHIRDVWPGVPIWLGGIYARLCTQHARKHSGADRVMAGSLDQVATALEETLGISLTNRAAWHDLSRAPAPALDLIPSPTYGPLVLSLGCPYRCPYCASSVLHKDPVTFSVQSLWAQVQSLHEQAGIRDFAFYDDALLYNGKAALKHLVHKVQQAGYSLRFHTPNALHVRALTDQGWCRLLFEAGFVTLRLGLETTHVERQRQWGGKTDLGTFERAMEALQNAGFSSRHIGVYLLAGVPEQTPEEVAEGIEVVFKAKAQPFVAEFSPIPGTALWPEAVKNSAFPLEDEPLTHNNSFFALRRADFSLEDLMTLKKLAREARRALAFDPSMCENTVGKSQTA
ncbi:B12-binding domain-containing radical SAM protein [Desulfosoma caldarium]|uniref:Radical SAM superfamily enzyme YgiQ (UPF0313 family) n=1 Tax=Desulfosoma caldarium TaxID=610254 RepID=A0A3N1UI34_9BACT|nr:radical SAM protein [Desulfosoma caldarium]ROQ90922.1 radical SAM superfamily enzyme YgiQ (UPF0313 family) [Desulfosoma caldarium]